MSDWPVLEPGDPRSACPRYMYIGADCAVIPSGYSCDPTPEALAARAERAEKRRLEAEARQIAREAAHAEKLHVNAERRAETRRLRAELAKRNKAERRAREKQERVKAHVQEPPKRAPKRARGGNMAPAAPEGYVGLPEAARRVGRSRTCLHVAAQEGRLPVLRFGRYVYVRMEDVVAYIEEVRASRKKNAARNLAKARAAKAVKNSRPWAKLLPNVRGRKRGAA